MTVYTSDGSTVAVFYSVRREDGKLVVDGKALDAMRMDMIFMLGEILNGLKMALKKTTTVPEESLSAILEAESHTQRKQGAS